MSTLPRRAYIGAFTYRIFEAPADWRRFAPEVDRNADHWGLTLHDPCVILLRQEMGPVMKRAILLHELLHACTLCASAHCATGRQTQEQWVTLAAPNLLDVVTRSPGMAAFLFGTS